MIDYFKKAREYRDGVIAKAKQAITPSTPFLAYLIKTHEESFLKNDSYDQEVRDSLVNETERVVKRHSTKKSVLAFEAVYGAGENINKRYLLPVGSVEEGETEDDIILHLKAEGGRIFKGIKVPYYLDDSLCVSHLYNPAPEKGCFYARRDKWEEISVVFHLLVQDPEVIEIQYPFPPQNNFLFSDSVSSEDRERGGAYISEPPHGYTDPDIIGIIHNWKKWWWLFPELNGVAVCKKSHHNIISSSPVEGPPYSNTVYGRTGAGPERLSQEKGVRLLPRGEVKEIDMSEMENPQEIKLRGVPDISANMAGSERVFAYTFLYSFPSE